MNLILDRNSFLVPLFPYILLALELAGIVAVYSVLKRELTAQAKRAQRAEGMLRRLRDAVSNYVPAAPEPFSADPPIPAVPTLRSGMNLNRRVQVLRLLRRGEDLGHIAAALSVPRREVELVVRVHQLTTGQPVATSVHDGNHDGSHARPPLAQIGALS